MTGFTLGFRGCEGVGQDSSYGYEGSHLMHDMIYSIYNCIFYMECGMMCMCHCICIYVGSNPYRKIHLLGIAHPVVGKYFQTLEVHQGMERIQDLSGEEKARFWFVLYFVNFGWKTPVFSCKKKRVVIKLISIHFG